MINKAGNFVLNASFATAILAVIFGGAVAGIFGAFWLAIQIFGNNPLAVVAAIVFVISAAFGIGFAIIEAKKP